MTPLPLPLALADELYRHGSTRTPKTVADELRRLHTELEATDRQVEILTDELTKCSKAYGESKAENEALKQALKPGEPVGEVAGYYERGFDQQKTLYGKLYNQDLPLGIKLFTAPQPQPKQEPVAWQWLDTATFRKKIPPTGEAECWNPLYSAPQPQREWVGLTDADVRELDTSEFWDDHTPADFVRLVEAKLREKNGADHIPTCGKMIDDTAGKMIAAGNRMAAMLDTSLTAPVEQWPDEAEIDAALKEWRFVADGVSGAGMDPRNQPCNPAEDGVCEALECCNHLRDATKMVDNDFTLIRYCQQNAGAPGHNQYGVPLHACNGYRCDEHYWAWLRHCRLTRSA